MDQDKTFVVRAPRPTTYRTIPLGTGQGKIVIEHWALSDEPRLENLLRRDPNGDLVWRARLPRSTGRECFVQMRRVGDAVLAKTYQGAEVLLDIESGEPLARLS